MRVNGLGVLLGMQEAARQMIAQRTGGKIINTASVAGKQGFALVCALQRSQVRGSRLTQAAARELAKHRSPSTASARGSSPRNCGASWNDMIEFGRTCSASGRGNGGVQ